MPGANGFYVASAPRLAERTTLREDLSKVKALFSKSPEKQQSLASDKHGFSTKVKSAFTSSKKSPPVFTARAKSFSSVSIASSDASLYDEKEAHSLNRQSLDRKTSVGTPTTASRLSNCSGLSEHSSRKAKFTPGILSMQN